VLNDLAADGVDKSLAGDFVVALKDVVDIFLGLLDIAFISDHLSHGRSVDPAIVLRSVGNVLLDSLESCLLQVVAEVMVVRARSAVDLDVEKEFGLLLRSSIRLLELLKQSGSPQLLPHPLVSECLGQQGFDEYMDHHNNGFDMAHDDIPPF
jgi:hypothetical protein